MDYKQNHSSSGSAMKRGNLEEIWQGFCLTSVAAFPKMVNLPDVDLSRLATNACGNLTVYESGSVQAYACVVFTCGVKG